MGPICALATALALGCCATATAASAWDGGASAPRSQGDGGGLAAPPGQAGVANAAQTQGPEGGEPGAGDLPATPVEPGPGAGAPDVDRPGTGPGPRPEDDREVGIVVPLPGDPADDQPPPAAAAPVATLPRTGRDTRLLCLIGLLLMTTGGAVRALSRPARAASA